MYRETTKVCPLCGNANLVMLKSTNEKACILHTPVFYFSWDLDEGQVSHNAGARAKRKAED